MKFSMFATFHHVSPEDLAISANISRPGHLTASPAAGDPGVSRDASRHPENNGIQDDFCLVPSCSLCCCFEVSQGFHAHPVAR